MKLRRPLMLVAIVFAPSVLAHFAFERLVGADYSLWSHSRVVDRYIYADVVDDQTLRVLGRLELREFIRASSMFSSILIGLALFNRSRTSKSAPWATESTS